MRRRLCRVDNPTFTPTHQRTQIFGNRQARLTKSALEDKQFSILKNCRSNLDGLIFEVLFIKESSPVLNTQKDSIHAKLLATFNVTLYMQMFDIIYIFSTFLKNFYHCFLSIRVS